MVPLRASTLAKGRETVDAQQWLQLALQVLQLDKSRTWRGRQAQPIKCAEQRSRSVFNLAELAVTSPPLHRPKLSTTIPPQADYKDLVLSIKMADPLSITASSLAVITAAVTSTRSLYETAKRFKDRDKTLGRLQDVVGDVAAILDSLKQVIDADESMLVLLQGPIKRCSQVCHEFEQSMIAFSGKSKTGFRDWAKMEFMRGDINEFIDTVAGYKSTISVGLGTITLRASKVSQQVLQEYVETIKDTAYNLKLQQQRIDERMTQLRAENTTASSIRINLEDEREVTNQCLRICEDARSYIDFLSDRESSLLEDPHQEASGRNTFEAQLRTRQAFDENRGSFAETINHLRRRLESLVQNGSVGNETERMRLESDISISKQCLEVCNVASEVSRQKVYRIGEVVADDNSDQVVVTTLADLFDIKKALSKGNSAQLVGSMTGDELRLLAEKRYCSRFGALVDNSDPAAASTTTQSSVSEVQKSQHDPPSHATYHEQSPGSRTRQTRPGANEMRKRLSGGITD